MGGLRTLAVRIAPVIAGTCLVVVIAHDQPPVAEDQRGAADPGTIELHHPQNPDPKSAIPRRYRSAAEGLAAFDSCDGVLAYVRANARDALLSPGPIETGGLPGTAVAAVAGGSWGGEGASAPAPAIPEVVGTNVQEQDVDEPDILKTDARTLVAVTGTTFRVVDVSGNEPRLVGSIELPRGRHELLLAGDRVLALSSAWNSSDLLDARESSRILVLDISDRSAPRVERTVTVDGRYLSARMVDGVARVVVDSSPRVSAVYPNNGTPAARGISEERTDAAIRNAGIEAWLPRFVVRAGNDVDRGVLASCDNTYHAASFSGIGMVTVFSLDPADAKPQGAASVFGDGEHVYATTENLYVATNRWSFDRSEDDGPRDLTSTDIHAFDISDVSDARYRASGEVAGQILNNWALSEQGEYLRVATTRTDPGADHITSNAVTVLTAREGKLVAVGRIDGFGSNERVYGVRFIGDRAFVVTFRRIDPLHVIDLSDPEHPSMAGQLEMPGYSAYLHPVGDDLLLGVGTDADEDGIVQGAQVSLFDVSDIAHPARVSHLRFEGTDAMEWEGSHAFLYRERARTAFMPIRNPYGQEPFDGAVAIGIGSTKLTEKGKIAHPRYRASWWGGSAVRRTAVVGERLYSLSEVGLLASDVETFEDRTWIPWDRPFTNAWTFAGSERGIRDGDPRTARFDQPAQLALDEATGTFFVADAGNKRIRIINPWWRGGVESLRYRLRIGDHQPHGDQTETELPDEPTGVALASDGVLYVATRCGVWQVEDPFGENATMSSVAGTPGPCSLPVSLAVDGRGPAASFGAIVQLAAVPDGILAADADGHAIRKIAVGADGIGTVSTVAGRLNIAGRADGEASIATFSSPRALDVLDGGRILVADTGNGAIRMVAGGKVTTVASALDHPTGIAYDVVRDSYMVTEAGTSHDIVEVRDGRARVVSGGKAGLKDGEAESARFSSPGSILIGMAGDMYVTDTGNNRIRWMFASNMWGPYLL